MTTADWSVVGASVIGASHLSRAVTCQDAHSYRALRRGALAIAVADGAGSFTEVGPGKVLQGLIKKVDRGMETRSA